MRTQRAMPPAVPFPDEPISARVHVDPVALRFTPPLLYSGDSGVSQRNFITTNGTPGHLSDAHRFAARAVRK